MLLLTSNQCWSLWVIFGYDFFRLLHFRCGLFVCFVKVLVVLKCAPELFHEKIKLNFGKLEIVEMFINN